MGVLNEKAPNLRFVSKIRSHSSVIYITSTVSLFLKFLLSIETNKIEIRAKIELPRNNVCVPTFTQRNCVRAWIRCAPHRIDRMPRQPKMQLFCYLYVYTLIAHRIYVTYSLVHKVIAVGTYVSVCERNKEFPELCHAHSLRRRFSSVAGVVPIWYDVLFRCIYVLLIEQQPAARRGCFVNRVTFIRWRRERILRVHITAD